MSTIDSPERGAAHLPGAPPRMRELAAFLREPGNQPAAGADSFDVIKSLLEDLDSERLLEESSVEVVPVRKANIDRLVGAITQILNRRYAELTPEVAKRVKPLVIADPRTSSLLVAGGPEDGALVREIVAKLDEIPANSAIGVHVLPLAAARAAASVASNDLLPFLASIMGVSVPRVTAHKCLHCAM